MDLGKEPEQDFTYRERERKKEKKKERKRERVREKKAGGGSERHYRFEGV
jgi:hypothetical protein